MYVRCAECLGSSWADLIAPGGELVCEHCERHHTVTVDGLGANPGEHYKRTMALSRQHGLDPTFAYSVLLGIMSLDRALELGRPKPESSRGVEKSRSPRPAVSPDIDPGFEQAIREGHLSVLEAIRRGDRDAWALRLMKRHGLERDTAYQVTDNRLVLAAALRARTKAAPESTAPVRAARALSRAQIGAILLLSAIGVGAVVRQLWLQHFNPAEVADAAVTARVASHTSQPEPASTTVLSTPAGTAGSTRTGSTRSPDLVRTRAGLDGSLTQVEGPDPRRVLAAYCGADPDLDPVDIAETPARVRGTRLGLFRDSRRVGEVFAIRIRRHWKTRQWVAGDGRAPIPVEEVR